MGRRSGGDDFYIQYLDVLFSGTGPTVRRCRELEFVQLARIEKERSFLLDNENEKVRS